MLDILVVVAEVLDVEDRPPRASGRAGKQFDLLATNSVAEPTNASLAASDGDLFLRTDKNLWCISAKK